MDDAGFRSRDRDNSEDDNVIASSSLKPPAATACRKTVSTEKHGELSRAERAAIKRRALRSARKFVHVSGKFEGIIRRDETQTKTGRVEVIVLNKSGDDHHTIGSVEVDDDGNVDLRGAYLIPPEEIKKL